MECWLEKSGEMSHFRGYLQALETGRDIAGMSIKWSWRQGSTQIFYFMGKSLQWAEHLWVKFVMGITLFRGYWTAGRECLKLNSLLKAGAGGPLKVLLESFSMWWNVAWLLWIQIKEVRKGTVCIISILDEYRIEPRLESLIKLSLADV